MAKITRVEVCKKNKNRSNIYVDDCFFCALFNEVVIKNKIKAGDIVDEERFKEISMQEETELAGIKAVNYLSKYIKTKNEVKIYLIKKGFNESICETVINKLEDYGYVNDAAFVKNYLEFKNKQLGEKLIKLELIKKGINKDDVNEIKIDEKTQSEGVKKLSDKYLKNKEINVKNLLKLKNYLYSKGFNLDLINKHCISLKGEDECGLE